MASSTNIVRTRSATNLAWVDLEMTGLEVERHAIVQAALIITDKDLNVLEEFVCDVWQPPEVLAQMSPFVRAMHEKNGLLARLEVARTDVGDAERKLMTILTGWCDYPATLCGNTIWQDRKFIDRYMPGLGRYLHYRLVDVSSLKVLAQLWHGEAAVYVKPKVQEHDALVDIRNSILELKHYKATLLQPTP